MGETDLISRRAAIDALCKAGCGSGYCGISCDDVKALEQLPSVQPDITEKQIAEYCRKRNLVLITQESFETLKAYYDRQNRIRGNRNEQLSR